MPVPRAGGPTLAAAQSQLVLPALTLGLFAMAPIARMTRASMLGVLGSDFVRTARPAGLSQRTVVVTYAVRNGMLPVITLLGMVFSFVILHLLAGRQERLGMAYLFVSHDLNLVRLLTDRVLVMYLERIVESGPSQGVFDRPAHPYTRALMSAVPALDPGVRAARVAIVGEPRSAIDPAPTVCRYHGRCPDGVERRTREMPTLRPGPVAEHAAACHFAFDGEALGHRAGR